MCERERVCVVEAKQQQVRWSTSAASICGCRVNGTVADMSPNSIPLPRHPTCSLATFNTSSTLRQQHKGHDIHRWIFYTAMHSRSKNSIVTAQHCTSHCSQAARASLALQHLDLSQCTYQAEGERPALPSVQKQPHETLTTTMLTP